MADDFVSNLPGYLPALEAETGSAWEHVRALLRQLFEDYGNALIEEERGKWAVEIEGLVMACAPDLWRRITLPASAPAEHASSSLATARPPENGPPAAFFSRAPRSASVDWPNVVTSQTQSVPVIVRLDPKSLRQRRAEFRFDEPVIVDLEAPAFESASTRLQLDPAKDEDTAIFRLRPTVSGRLCLRISFTQGARVIGLLEAGIQVLAHSDVDELELLVFRENDKPLCLSFLLFETLSGHTGQRQQRVLNKARPTVDLQHMLAGLYTELGTLATPPSPGDATAAEVAEHAIRNVGNALWREFVPDDLRSYYLRHRDRWHGNQRARLTITSDDPEVPWELVWPDDEKEPWCQRFDIARWLRYGSTRRPIDPPAAELTVRRFAPVLSEGIGSRAVVDEHAFLRELIRRYGLHTAGPTGTTYLEFAKWVEGNDGPTADWLHVTCHGAFDAEHPTEDSRLIMSDRRAFKPTNVNGAVEARIRSGHCRAWVFNSCQAGRCNATRDFTRGWAPRLLEAGVGLFIAPLWPVRTTTAAQFTQTLYPLLFRGVPVGRAVRVAREATRLTGDPSWAAYVLYGRADAIVHVDALADDARSRSE